jgi:hypothetical protein
VDFELRAQHFALCCFVYFAASYTMRRMPHFAQCANVYKFGFYALRGRGAENFYTAPAEPRALNKVPSMLNEVPSMLIEAPST